MCIYSFRGCCSSISYAVEIVLLFLFQVQMHHSVPGPERERTGAEGRRRRLRRSEARRRMVQGRASADRKNGTLSRELRPERRLILRPRPPADEGGSFSPSPRISIFSAYRFCWSVQVAFGWGLVSRLSVEAELLRARFEVAAHWWFISLGHCHDWSQGSWMKEEEIVCTDSPRKTRSRP